jgi:hypothetical protein
MPNSFIFRQARVNRADAEEPGSRPVSVPTAAVRDFFVLVFASLLVPTAPICQECEKSIPPTKCGRRSRKDVCRACQDKRYYGNLKVEQPEKLRSAWKASKRRNRRKRT